MATSCGVLLAWDPIAMAIFIVIWSLLFAISRLVSIASLIGLLSSTIYFVVRNNYLLFAGAIIMFLIVLIRHRENLQRLLAGTENKL